MSRRIENDEQLEKAIAGMQRLTEQIEEFEENYDPLNDGDYKKNVLILCKTAELVQVYSRGRVAERHPDRIPHYNDMGLEYQTFGGTA